MSIPNQKQQTLNKRLAKDSQLLVSHLVLFLVWIAGNIFEDLKMSTTCYGLLRRFIFLALVAGAAASRFGALDAPPRGGASAGLSSKIAGPLQSFARTVRGARDHLVAAGVARSVSIFALYPMDTVKTRMQMGQEAPLRLTGIFSGVGGSLAGQVPYG